MAECPGWLAVADLLDGGQIPPVNAVVPVTTRTPTSTTLASSYTPLYSNFSPLFHRLRLMSAANFQHDPPGQDHRRSVDSVAGQEVSLPPRDPALRTNGPYRYPHHIFVTSTEEVQGSQQSLPTYHRVPTSSQVALDSRSFTDLEAPPYRSRINLGERDEKHIDIPMPEDRAVDEKAPLKGVHYASDLDSPSVHPPAIIRVDSDVPSVAGTDDEYDKNSDYDWSGEEDLVDEEAKFEEQMGKGEKRKGWGPKRHVQFGSCCTGPPC